MALVGGISLEGVWANLVTSVWAGTMVTAQASSSSDYSACSGIIEYIADGGCDSGNNVQANWL